ncbi:DNA-3-methyladenine glycosylase I [Granulicoccus sp. GXG6511]|uniref:DNA-3-methyladenine glycosylase I n=1 Tax=Granulicoccus sp. GXG6511 TaxID=3381351 RepID=UPI003D7C3DA1
MPSPSSPACPWPGAHPDYRAYHDDEWGRPVRDDQRLFEKLVLEGFQSGLSWLTILRKRPAFRAAFMGFDPARVAVFGDDDLARLMSDAGIVRNRRKIEAAIANARTVLTLADAHGSFADFVWRFAPDQHTRPATMADVPPHSAESTALAKELKEAGARFVGPTTVYAFMQAMGLVNDHLVGCPAGDAIGTG